MFNRRGKNTPLQMPKVVPGMKILIKTDGSCEDYDDKTAELLGKDDGHGNLILRMRPDGAVDWYSQVNEDGKDARKRIKNHFLSTPEQTKVIRHILYNLPLK